MISDFVASQRQAQPAAEILGVHLEGPFLNPEKRGAHPGEYLLPLTIDQVQQVLGDYAQIVKVMTLAPELDSSGEVIAYLRSLGITVSLGHSLATAAQAQEAFTGMAVIQACEDVIAECKKRAAKLWGVDEDQVEWEDGSAVPGPGVNADVKAMTLAELAGSAAKTGGPIQGRASVNAQGAGASFSVNFADLKVDRETGKVDVLSYTAIQDAGTAIHPAYVEGQMQGGAAQGIGWALNEEYIFNDDGVMENAGFLDYRIPVASDLPMIETEIVEVPNPSHPYGVRGVGETPIVAPLAVCGNAVSRALGKRMTDLPLSPPNILDALD